MGPTSNTHVLSKLQCKPLTAVKSFRICRCCWKLSDVWSISVVLSSARDSFFPVSCADSCVTRFSILVFFHQSVSPQPQSILLGPFRIFSKIRGDIRSPRLTTGVVDICGKWEKSSIRKILIILLGHRFKFCRKFAEIFAAQGWPPVSTTPVANLKRP